MLIDPSLDQVNRSILEAAKLEFLPAPAYSGKRLTRPAVNLSALSADLARIAKQPSSQPKDLALSLALADMVNVVSKRCWRNAFASLLYLEGQNASYVEGWTIEEDSERAIEHGWLEVEGKIVDPTWGASMMCAVYFAGLRLTLSDALVLWASSKSLPIVEQYGRGGLDHPGYNRAYHDASMLAQPVDCAECAVAALCEAGSILTCEPWEKRWKTATSAEQYQGAFSDVRHVSETPAG